MLDLRPEDAIHKSYLNRLLIEVCDQPRLSQVLAFKGGTCASMLGFLDRFSVDLDFDLIQKTGATIVREEFRRIFDHLGLAVTKEFDDAILFQVRYPSAPGRRNSIKVGVNSLIVTANQYKVQYFPEIDRLLNSQTAETMFANKLVAVMDRYRLHQTVAGRDIYDIHHFFISGYAYLGSVIRERTGDDPRRYFEKLIEFIRQNVTQTLINEDLNTLLPNHKFQEIRKVLLPETINFLIEEQSNLGRMVD